MSNELLDPRLPPLVRIVDDDDRVRQSEAFVLRLEGFDVREYSSAEDFLHFDDVSRAGCIVLDIRMPGMNGLELQSVSRDGRIISFYSIHLSRVSEWRRTCSVCSR